MKTITVRQLAEIERQALATRDRGLARLPESWWEPDVAVRMADWIERFGARR